MYIELLCIYLCLSIKIKIIHFRSFGIKLLLLVFTNSQVNPICIAKMFLFFLRHLVNTPVAKLDDSF